MKRRRVGICFFAYLLFVDQFCLVAGEFFQLPSLILLTFEFSGDSNKEV